jgi:hypothetical protein
LLIGIKKRNFPRFKLCGGLLSQKTIMLLQDVFKAKVSELEASGLIHFKAIPMGVGNRSGNCLRVFRTPAAFPCPMVAIFIKRAAKMYS